MSGHALPADVRGYYERGGEWDRLSHGTGLLEFLRTQQILRRALPTPPAIVLDVGGAAGVHAAWLAEDGYEVRLIDPLELHVEQARERARSQAAHPFTAELGDARTLAAPDESADAVLLLGPLYHLSDRSERVAALAEARRVLRPGGVMAAAAIGRFGDWFYGLLVELLDDPDFRQMAAQSMLTGQHRTVGEKWFTTSYFHDPDDLAAECTEAGLEVRSIVVVEGIGAFLADLDERLADPARRAHLLDGLATVEADRSLLGATSHLMAIATRGGSRTLPG